MVWTIVPAEAVVAIFEVKRTLNKETIKKAQEQLGKIMDFIPLSKDHYKNISQEE